MNEFALNDFCFIFYILALPRSPSNVRVSDVQPTSVRLSWSYDGDVQSEVTYFLLLSFLFKI